MSAVIFTGCSVQKTDNSENVEDAKVVASADDLPGAKIGVQLGTTGDIYASEFEEKG